MSLTQRGKPEVDTSAEDRDRRHAEGAGDVHRTTVVAHQQFATLDESHKLAQSDSCCDDAFDLAKRGAVPLRIDEGNHAYARTCCERQCHLAKAIEGPTLFGNTRSRMDSDN